MEPRYLIDYPAFLHPQLGLSSPPARNSAYCTYHNPFGMSEYSWSIPPEPPYIFSLSATPSDDLNGSPQMQHGLHVATPTFLGENQPNDTQTPYIPCDAISPPTTTNPASHVFNLSQFYSANNSGPPAGKALPTPPFSFGDIQSSFAFNVDEFWPLLGYEEHSSTSDLSSITDPVVVPEDEPSPSLNSRTADSVSEERSPPSGPASTPPSPVCSKNSKVATVPRKSRSSRRSPSSRPSKKSKPAEDEIDEGSVRIL